MPNIQDQSQKQLDMDSFDSYFECITACYGLKGEDIECVTQCVEVHLEEGEEEPSFNRS